MLCDIFWLHQFFEFDEITFKKCSRSLIPQGVIGMKCRQEFVGAQMECLAVHVIKRLAQAHAVKRGIAESDDKLRIDSADFFFEECRMHFQFLGTRLFAFREAMLERTGQVDMAAVNAVAFKQLIK